MQNTIRCPTDLTADTILSYKPRVEEIATHLDDVILDFSSVEFIDSSGVGALVFLFKRLWAHGHTLRIVGAHGQPLRLIQHLALDRLLTPATDQSVAA